MTPELKYLLEAVAATGGELFAKNGMLDPVWHAVKRTGEHMIFAPPSSNRDTSAAIVRAAFKVMDVVRYVFMDEAWIWMAAAETDETEIRRWFEAGLRDHPNRIEVVMLTGEDASGQVCAYRKIVRTVIGRATLGPLEIHDEIARAEGRIVGMLHHAGRQQ